MFLSYLVQRSRWGPKIHNLHMFIFFSNLFFENLQHYFALFFFLRNRYSVFAIYEHIIRFNKFLFLVLHQFKYLCINEVIINMNQIERVRYEIPVEQKLAIKCTIKRNIKKLCFNFTSFYIHFRVKSLEFLVTRETNQMLIWRTSFVQTSPGDRMVSTQKRY